MTFESKPAFSKIAERRQSFSDGKNWAMLNASVLIIKFLIHPVQIKCVSTMPASEVDLNLSPPS